MDAFCQNPKESSLYSMNSNNISVLDNTNSYDGVIDSKVVESILQHKCKVHLFESCNLIHFRPNIKDVRVCFACAQAQSIPHQELLPIAQLLNAKSEEILTFYPALEVQTAKNLREMIGSVDSLIDEVNEFYSEMTKVIISALEKSRQTQKLKINQIAEAYQQVLNSYHEASKIKEFQGLFYSNKDSNQLDEKLAEFINELHKKSNENTQIINQSYEKFEVLKNKYSLDKPKEIITYVSNILQQLDLFAYSDTLPLTFNQPNNQPDQQQLFSQLFTGQYPTVPQNQISQQNNALSKYLLSSIVFVPQKKGRNQQKPIEINRQSNGQIVIRNKDELNVFGAQCHMTQALNPNEKYVIRLILHNYQQTSQIRFGLIEATNKQSEWLRTSEISYMDVDGGSVTRIIKGGQLHSGVKNNIIGIKGLEVRIHQAGKVFKVGSYPDYLNVASLGYLDAIKQNVSYVFSISIQNFNDQVTVTDFFSVRQFDDNMDN